MGKSGAGRTCWVSFEKINAILHKDRATEPAATSSSCETIHFLKWHSLKERSNFVLILSNCFTIFDNKKVLFQNSVNCYLQLFPPCHYNEFVPSYSFHHLLLIFFKKKIHIHVNENSKVSSFKSSLYISEEIHRNKNVCPREFKMEKFILQQFVNKFCNFYQYLTLARMLMWRGHWLFRHFRTPPTIFNIIIFVLWLLCHLLCKILKIFLIFSCENIWRISCLNTPTHFDIFIVLRYDVWNPIWALFSLPEL